MSSVFIILANIFIVGLFLHSKLGPHKNKIRNNYKASFNFFDRIFTPALNFLKRHIKPLHVGKGLAVDLSQVILLIFLLLIINLKG